MRSSAGTLRISRCARRTARRPRPRRRRQRTPLYCRSSQTSRRSSTRSSRTPCPRSGAVRTSARGSGSGRRPPPPSSPRARTTGRTAPRPYSCLSRGRASISSRRRTSSSPSSRTGPTCGRSRSRPVTSPRYTTDFDEIKSLGEINSTTRSAEQTDIGRFWGAAPVQNVWNQIAQTAGMSFDNSLEQNARMFALLDASLADGVIALYDSKYAYHRWRPVTAVRAADNDGNSDTTGDPNWTPLAVTALDPSYAGAHAEISQSAAATLHDFFGTDLLDFSLTNPSLPGVVRSFQSFSQAADEAAVSRIYAGQHFRYDEDAGQTLGDEVGNFVFDSILEPVPHPGASSDQRPQPEQGHQG